MSSNRFDPLDENEREWLRSSRRARSRRAWVAVAGIAVILGLLVWLVVALLPFGGGGDGNPPAATSANDRVIADSRRALQDWGRFGVTGDLNMVRASFWQQGPQYRQLRSESGRLKRRPLGNPPYQFTLRDPVTVLPFGKDRIVRGTVTTSRQGQPTHQFKWDLYMRSDPQAGGRWRVWTVAETPAGG